MPRRKPAVKFATPPPTPTRPDWDAVAAALTAAPMEWATVFENGKYSTAVAVMLNHIKAMHSDLGFERMTRNNKKWIDESGKEVRTCDLWMRYDPSKDTTKPTTRRKKG